MRHELINALHKLRVFLRDSSGVTSLLFALLLIPIAAMSGAALDFARSYGARSAMQGAADAAALASLYKFEASEDSRRTIGEDVFSANLLETTAHIASSPDISFNEETATVSASASVSTVLLGIIHIDSIKVSVKSVAQQAPKVGPVCILALDRSADEALGLDGTASVVADDCVVHSNSRSDSALTAPGSTSAHADTFCAVGGYSGNNFSPQPIRNCSVAADPFEDLELPATGGCDFLNKKYNKGSHTIQPGIYCGGMSLNAYADVEMAPGIYIIKDGPLTMHAQSWLRGTDVTIFLVGEDAVLNIMSNSNVDITAPSFGPYAGLAIVQDRKSDFGETSLIEGGGVVRIVGTVYLPEQILKTGGEGVIGQDSPFMPIIAKKLKFHGNATIQINLDADAQGYPDFLPDVRSGTPRLVS